MATITKRGTAVGTRQGVDDMSPVIAAADTLEWVALNPIQHNFTSITIIPTDSDGDYTAGTGVITITARAPNGAVFETLPDSKGEVDIAALQTVSIDQPIEAIKVAVTTSLATATHFKVALSQRSARPA